MKTAQKEPFRFRPHTEKQDSLIHSCNELTIAGTGTQWGKSIAGSLWMLTKIAKYTAPGDNFLLMAPTYKIMNQSQLPYFLSTMKGLGKFKKVDAAFELPGDRNVYLRTERDPDSIVGIPNIRAYWLDEAGKVGLYYHENIQARAASRGAEGLYTTSPYSRNWLYKNYIKPKNDGKLPDLKLIQAASWENPFHSLADPDRRAKMQASMDPRRFEMLFGGVWGKQAGLVYDCFDDAENICEPFRLPNGTVFYAGVDWGHTEPFVIVVRAITPDHRHFQVSEFYKTGLTVPAQVLIAKQKMQTFGIKQFFCGHERPENILLFNQNGLPAVAVPEKNIQVGTDLHYELVKTRRYKLFNRLNPYTIDEYNSYHYPEPVDLEADDDAEDQSPVGQNDHAMSANRFVTLRTYRSHLKSKPFVPDEGTDGGKAETQEARLRRLMRPSRSRET